MSNASFPLNSLKNVNTVLGLLYKADGTYRAGFNPDEFYNTILLDTLKYNEENYVHLKYAEVVNIRRGMMSARFRRWAGLTPTLQPLKEGIPTAMDKHAYETIEVGNIFSFGRASEYTDTVDNSMVSEIVAERALQYGEVAAQTKELYARAEWLSSPNEFFANFKEGFADLAFGDEITLDDLRFLIARMKRVLVKPINGKYNYICSTEFLNGLIDDPRVKQYMAIEQTTGKLFGTGEPFDLFELSFIPTMFDEFAFPDISYPGVYEVSAGVEAIRLYAINGTTIYYLDVHQDFEVKSGVAAKTISKGTTYLNNGTAVEDLVGWEIPTDADSLENDLVATTADLASDKCVARKSTMTTSLVDGVRTTTFSALASATADFATINSLIDAGAFSQLPVHRGILFGDEAMIKINVEGLTDTPEIIRQPLGSAGALDPLKQRQTIGFKVTGFGLAIKRPEAICITYGIPKNAQFAALTAQYVGGDAILMDNRIEYADFSASVQYEIGDITVYKGVMYKFKAQHTAGAWNAAHVTALTVTEINAILESSGEQYLRVDGVNKGGFPGETSYAGANHVTNVLSKNPLDNGGNDDESNTR